MNGSLKAGRKRRQNNRFPAFASLSVFVLLASFAAIGKLLELHIIAFQICEDGLFRGYPVAGGSVSTLEWACNLRLRRHRLHRRKAHERLQEALNRFRH